MSWLQKHLHNRVVFLAATVWLQGEPGIRPSVRVMWQNPQSIPAWPWPSAWLSLLFAITVSKDTALFYSRPTQKSLMVDLILCCGHLEMFINFWAKDSILSFCMVSCKLCSWSCFHSPGEPETAGRALVCHIADNVDQHFINGWKVDGEFVQGNVWEQSLQRTLGHPCLLFDSLSSQRRVIRSQKHATNDSL